MPGRNSASLSLRAPPVTGALGTLSAPKVATTAEIIPWARIDGGITVAPRDSGAFADWVGDPRVDSWFAVQGGVAVRIGVLGGEP